MIRRKLLMASAIIASGVSTACSWRPAGRSWATAGVEVAKEMSSRARQARVRIVPTKR